MHLVAFSTDRRLLAADAPLQKAYAARLSSYTLLVGSKKWNVGGRRIIAENAQAIGVDWRFLFSVECWRLIKRADVLSSQDPFEAGFLAWIVAAVFRKPLHVQVHTDIFARSFTQMHAGNRFRQYVARWVISRAARVRVVSAVVKEKLTALGVKAPMTVLPIFVDVAAFQQVERVKHPRFKIALLMIGRLEAEKRFEEGIKALALLRAHGHDAGLTIVGSGSRRTYLQKVAQENKVDGFVTFAGNTHDVRPYVASADVLLLPSAYEGYGLVIIEALAAGVPVIATDVGIAKEVGAIIAPHEDFPGTVLSWASGGPRQGVLHGYPYTTQDAYVHAWVADVSAAAKTLSH